MKTAIILGVLFWSLAITVLFWMSKTVDKIGTGADGMDFIGLDEFDFDHCIVLGYGAMPTPGASYEFVFGDPKLGYYWMKMTHEEYVVLTGLVKRARKK